MGVKKRNEVLFTTAEVDEEYKSKLENLPADTLTVLVKTFIESGDLTTQLTTLKKISRELKSANYGENVGVVLDVIINAFLRAPYKSQVKKTTASVLQSLPLNLQQEGTDALKQQLLTALTVRQTEPNSGRYGVDNIAAMMDNFIFGEKCILQLYNDVLTFINDALRTFHSLFKAEVNPVSLTKLMQNCHFTVQIYNKILHKLLSGGTPVRRTGTPPCEELIERKPDCQELFQRENLQDVTAQTISFLIDILYDDDFLLDCRAACAMTVPLIAQVFHNTNVVTKLSACVRGEAVLFAGLNIDLPSLSSVSQLCITHGLLAMLSTQDYSSEAGCRLMISTLAPAVLSLMDKLEDSNEKLMASRTLLLLTSKALQVLQSKDCPDAMNVEWSGKAAIPQAVIGYAFNQWEDSIDAIRYQARVVFENTIQCHLQATKEESSDSEFLVSLIESLLQTSAHTRGRYGPLCCMVRHLGATTVLNLDKTLPDSLLALMAEQTLAPYVCELFETLYTYHHREVTESADLTRWHQTWVDPMLHILCTGSRQQKTFIIELLLMKLLKLFSSTLSYMVKKLSSSDSEGDTMGAIVTCVNQAKVCGLLSGAAGGDDPQLWRGVVPITTLRHALIHTDDQVRLDACALLCENPRVTEIVSEVDLTLLRSCLPDNLSSQEPAFRQHLVALCKKLFVRLRDGGHALQRIVETGNKRHTDTTQTQRHLDNYRGFLQWLGALLFNRLHPIVSFPSRTTCLSMLSIMTAIFGTEVPSDASTGEFQFLSIVTPSQVQTLLECFTDTFEHNKQEAFTILAALPTSYLDLQDPERLKGLLTVAMTMAVSTRPQDCSTVAYLLRLLVRIPSLHTVMLKSEHNTAPSLPTGHADKCGSVGLAARCVKVVGFLLDSLDQQLAVAHKSLMHAAATQPMYPTLHCLRYLLADIDLRSADCHQAQWCPLLARMVRLCFAVAEAVSPVVSNSSPEGHVPEGTTLGPDLTLDAVVMSSEDQQLLEAEENSAAKVSLMPEYLIVCCWRSIKEVSLLLGQLTCSISVQDAETGSDGLLTSQLLCEIGQYFIRQLLESRHRGAFELAYAGFVKMAEVLWRCPVRSIQCLPAQWIQKIMEDISVHDPEDRFCSTRRSAGIPFYVQALVTTEPTNRGRPHFRQVMSRLLQMAAAEQSAPTENTSQIHALNILRALYRDTRLGEDVFPFIADGIKVAMHGYSSQLWLIRNSATLLFSALIVRIFGVQRTKEELTKKNCLTGRVFFHRFPSLFEFLLSLLRTATEHIEDVGDSGRSEMCPGLYPVLLLLGRLYPSTIENANTNLNLNAFIPLVQKCAHSPVNKTRLMSARALCPLVSADLYCQLLADLLLTLPTTVGAASSHNHIHGTLLQLLELQRVLCDLPLAVRDEACAVMVTGLHAACWLGSGENECFPVRTAYTELIDEMSSLIDTTTPHLDASTAAHWQNLLAIHRTQLLELFIPSHTCSISNTRSVSACRIRSQNIPGFSEHTQKCATYLLRALLSGEDTDVQQLDEVLVNLLLSQSYEVRLEALNFLQNNQDKNPSVSLVESKCEITDFCSNRITDEYKTDSIISESASSVFHQLVSMAMETETHDDCLSETLHALWWQPLKLSFPWHSLGGSTYSGVAVLTRLLDLASHTRDTVRCAAVRVASSAFLSLYTSSSAAAPQGAAIRDAAEEWCQMLEESSTTEQSAPLRREAAAGLRLTARAVLWGREACGDSVRMRLWGVMLRLLQDEDSDVRQIMATVVMVMQEGLPDQYKGVCGLPPPVALRAVLRALCARHWGAPCLRALLRAARGVTHPDRAAQDPEVRLFDRSEMNTYCDELEFVEHVLDVLGDALRDNTPGHCTTPGLALTPEQTPTPGGHSLTPGPVVPLAPPVPVAGLVVTLHEELQAALDDAERALTDLVSLRTSSGGPGGAMLHPTPHAAGTAALGRALAAAGLCVAALPPPQPPQAAHKLQELVSKSRQTLQPLNTFLETVFSVTALSVQ